MKWTRDVKRVGTRGGRGRGYEARAVELIPYRGTSWSMQGMINGVQDIQNCHASRVANHHGETGRSGEDDAEICERRGSSGQGEC